MPRHPDPDLEDRILKAAQRLWKRGGDKALTMRTVARAAGTNTPAVYRRFKDRSALVRGLLLRIVQRLREDFSQGQTVEEVAEIYLDQALRLPHEYELFYTHSHELTPPKGPGRARPIRDSRPNFAYVEKLLAERFGGSPDHYTQLALALWATMHGSATLLLARTIPEGHEEELREASRKAVKALLAEAGKFSGKA